MTHTLKVEHNELTDEYYIILPNELLTRMGWSEGDKIEWKIKNNNSFVLKKIKEKK